MIALALSFGMLDGEAYAFGFGEPEVSSALGQPLRMRVALQPDPSVDLSQPCLHLVSSLHDVLPTLSAAKLSIEEQGAARYLHIDSLSAIDEPILRVVVDAGCVQHVRREFTVLLDPPLAQAAAPGPLAGASLGVSGMNNVVPPEATVASELAGGATLDLGVARIHGRVGEALVIEIPVSGRAAAALDNASVRVAQLLAADGKPLHNPLQASLSRSDAGTLLQLVSGDVVAEPALRVVVEVAAPDASVRREYGVLLDLPAAPQKAQPPDAAVTAAAAAPNSSSAAATATGANPPTAASADALDEATAPPSAIRDESPSPPKPAKRRHAHHSKLSNPPAIAEAPRNAPAAAPAASAHAPATRPAEQGAGAAEPGKGADHLQLTAPADDAAFKRYAEMDRRVQDLTQEIVKLRGDLALQKQREADLVAEGGRSSGSWIAAVFSGLAAAIAGFLLWNRRRGAMQSWDPASWDEASPARAEGRETLSPQGRGAATRMPSAAVAPGAGAPGRAELPASPERLVRAGSGTRSAAQPAGRSGSAVSGADPITISPLTTPIEVTEVLASEPSIEQLYTLFYDIGGNTAPGGKLSPAKMPQPSNVPPPVALPRTESLDINLGIPESVQSPRAARAQGAMKLSAAAISAPGAVKDSPPPAPAFSYTGNALPGRALEPARLDVATNVGPMTEIPHESEFAKTQPGLDLDLSTQPGPVTHLDPTTEMPHDDLAEVAPVASGPATLDLDLSTSIGRSTEIGPLTEIPRDDEEAPTEVALDLNLSTGLAGYGGEPAERESDPFAITTIPAAKNSAG